MKAESADLLVLAAALRTPEPAHGRSVRVAYILVQTDVGVIGDVAGEITGIKGELLAEAVSEPTMSSPRPW